MKYVREEISLVTDSMSALVLSECKRIIQIGHDATDANSITLLAANMLVELDDGRNVDLMLRGCFVALGKTSELEVKSITRALDHLKDLLSDWHQVHKQMFGEELGLADASGITLTKALGGSSISDNAAAASKTSRMLIELMMDKLKDMIAGGDESVEALPAHVKGLFEDMDLEKLGELTDDELNEVAKSLVLSCNRHTSNLLIKPGVKAEKAYLKE